MSNVKYHPLDDAKRAVGVRRYRRVGADPDGPTVEAYEFRQAFVDRRVPQPGVFVDLDGRAFVLGHGGERGPKQFPHDGDMVSFDGEHAGRYVVHDGRAFHLAYEEVTE